MKSFIPVIFLLVTCQLNGQSIDTAQIRIEIDTLFAKAERYKKVRDFDAAIEVGIRAEALAKDHLTKKHPSYTHSLYLLGEIYYAKRDFAEASMHYLNEKELLENYQRQNTEEYIVCLRNLGACRWRQARYPEAVTFYDQGVERSIAVRGRYHPKTASIISSKGGLLATMGKFKEAKPLFIESKEIIEETLGKETPLYARATSDLARLYAALDDMEKAEELYLEVKELALKRGGKEDEDYGISLYNLGDLYLRGGQYKQAEILLREALPIYEKSYGENDFKSSWVIQSIGRALALQKKYAEAEPLFLRSKEIRETIFGKQHPSYATTINHLGILYIEMEQYEKAEPLLLESLELRRKKKGTDHLDLIYPLMELGRLYHRLGKFEEGETSFKEAEGIARENYGDFHLETALILGFASKLYVDWDRVEESRFYLTEYLRVVEELSRRRARHLNGKEMQDFLNTHDKAIDLFHSFNHQHKIPSMLELAYNSNLFYKGYLLNNALETNRLLAKASDEIRNKYHELKVGSKKLAQEYAQPISNQGDLRDLEESVNQLEKELIREVAGLASIEKEVNWKDVQGALKEGEVAVEFLNYGFTNPEEKEEQYYSALIIKKNSPHPQLVQLFNEKEIGSLRAIPQLYANKGKLQEGIWSRLEQHLKDIHTIHYSPSGLLHLINVGAIPINETEVMADRFSMFRIGSTRQIVLPDLTNENQIVDAAVFGGVDYGKKEASEDLTALETSNDEMDFASERAYRGGAWEALSWTEEEANEIKDIIQRNKGMVFLYKNEKASEAAFKDLSVGGASPKIIHLSTHGYFFSDKLKVQVQDAKNAFVKSDDPMMRSGLILAGANHAWLGGSTKIEEEDGILTALEITNLDLSNTELVVLSACETGLGDIQGSEGVYGLQRAFKIAGAKYILMSLWKVNDVETYEFMTSFYKEWMEKGKTIPEAYKNTQNLMRQKQPNNARSWGGFVLIE